MATSQSHKLGEFIGTFFEELMKIPIRDFAEAHGLFFDSFGPRKGRRGKKLTWTDIQGNRHDLDFVLEKNGSDETIGSPVAFIELAWCRYTKHSKNKVQEIAGAVNPICEKYKNIQPFKGALLVGMFTENSLKQLQSEGFKVLYIPFEKLVQAFAKHGLDVYFDEQTKESDLKKKFAEVSKKTNRELLEKVREQILKDCEQELSHFLRELSMSYDRKVKSICILPLHGLRTEVVDVRNAIDFLNGYTAIPEQQQLEYIEIIVTYNNGTIIQCRFKDKDHAVEYLSNMK